MSEKDLSLKLRFEDVYAARDTDPDVYNRFRQLAQQPQEETVISNIVEQAPHAELDLEAEWTRQADNFTLLGFHIERGFEDTDEGRQQYRDTLAKFEPQPEGYKGRFDKPMLVEYQIPWEQQAKLAGVTIAGYVASHKDQIQVLTESFRQISEGTNSYTGWFNKWGEGDFPNPIGPFSARRQLSPDLVGGNMFDAIAQQIHFPEDNKDSHYYDIIGVSVESDEVPCLYRWDGGPRLAAYWENDAYPDFRPLVRGSEIVTC